MLWIFAGNIAPRGARARLLNGLVAPLAIRLNMTMTIWSALARLGIVRERPIDRSVDELLAYGLGCHPRRDLIGCPI